MADPVRRRSTWPLYLVAGLAFIPLLGFFFGSVALTWALLSGRPGAKRAGIIAATGALLNIAGLALFSILTVPGESALQQGYATGVGRGLADIVVALEEHHTENHVYPASLAALQRARGPLHPVAVADLGQGILRMRVGRNYRYVLSPDGSSYDLFSVGPDGAPGTPDDIRPLLPDSLNGRTGYKPTP